MKKTIVIFLVILFHSSVNAQDSVPDSVKISMISEALNLYKDFNNLKLYIGVQDIKYDCPEKFDGLNIPPNVVFRSQWGDFNEDGFTDVLLSGNYDKVNNSDSTETNSFISILSNYDGVIRETAYTFMQYDDVVITYVGPIPDDGAPLFGLYIGLNQVIWLTWDGKDFDTLPHDDL